ncbi:MAG: sigma-70 family RNA polymerase sigma factor [Myxococcales bacterium]|nr:sigma-70 family RNA polymerase sigma factor [Myxococcales bacterium]
MTQLHAISNVDRRAFDRTVAPHLPALRAAAVRLTGSAAEADDVLQETMTRAWTFWDRYEQGTNVRAWMHRILYNTFVNGYRRRRREREVLTRVHRESEPPTVGPRRDGAGLSDEVVEALDGLRDEFRNVVQLVDMADYSYQEAAEALGCPMGTVMSRLHRGRRALKEKLAPYAVEHGFAVAC